MKHVYFVLATSKQKDIGRVYDKKTRKETKIQFVFFYDFSAVSVIKCLV